MQSQDKKTRVFVGLSGGVDSAVSAALLKKEGYDVTGVFIKAWTPEGYPCTWKEDRRSAMRAAAVLDIPFITLDLEKEYKKEVVDYMIAEYKAGRTPNPDVMCNKEIKFGHFLKFALQNGTDFIATGHYAQVKNQTHQTPGVGHALHPVFGNLVEGEDKNKDQSYFLWTLTQEQLKHILFPVGHLQKTEVRKLAGKFGLPQEIRKDSQGLCFLGKIDMKEFLKDYLTPKKGNVLNEDGEIIGEHDGAVLFTIGERHGFSLTKKTPNDEPMYVISKDIDKNTITIAPKTASQKVLESPRSARPDIFSKQFLVLENVNWISGTAPENKNLSCRIRYRGEKIGCVLEGNKVILDKPEAISPGQSLVFYQEEKCLGGGIMA